jgi:hypothetical protein
VLQRAAHRQQATVPTKQTIRINKARSQVQFAAEWVDVARSVEYEKDQHGYRDNHKYADTNLAQTYIRL